MQFGGDVTDIFASLPLGLDRINIPGSVMMFWEAALSQAEMKELIADKIGNRPVRFESRLVRSWNRYNVFMLGHGLSLKLKPRNIVVVALWSREQI
jgi:hypothetical protein